MRGRPVSGLEGTPTSEVRPESRLEPRPEPRRAVVSEEQFAVRAVLERLLRREGYAVEVWGGSLPPAPGPALVLVAEAGGLHVLAARDVGGFSPPGVEGSEDGWKPPDGEHVFVPKPFGVGDVLRAVREVDGAQTTGG